MANPQWKSYQPPVQDPAILAFSDSKMNKAHAANLTNGGQIYNGNSNNSIRETGIVEKMLHSYGFIQCYDREARLFFHFSEYSENIETLKISDPVEFQMSFDRRTGKPIAISVVKMEKGAVTFEVLSETRINGTVVSEAKLSRGMNGSTVTEGSLSYETSGETFFLPYESEEVENNKKLSLGDKVTFFVATNKRTRTQYACQIQLEVAVEQERVMGVICSMKDTYGFIERADAVREIFFHFSEFTGNLEDLALGDDVEFSVQSRNAKEVAVNIKPLPEGTVIFEDVGVEIRRGKITKTLRGSQGRRHSDPLAGRITYETVKGPIDIPFGDKDQAGDYSLHQDDLVQFRIATDRRDQLQRATQITLIQDTFVINGEERETGIVASTKDGYGFIRCADRDARMFFHFSELLDVNSGDIRPNEEVQFTVVTDPTQLSRLVAVRIQRLARGTVHLESVRPDRLTGVIEKEPANYKQSSGKNKEGDPGIITYDVNGTKQMIPYSSKTVQGNPPKCGDKVEFQMEESKRNNTKTAINVKLLSRNQSSRQQGFIAAMKESYGFIETAEHNKELFFHFSNSEGDLNDYDVGDEVEFSEVRKMNKSSAENIRKLKPGTVAPEEIVPGVHDGKIIRSLRIVNPDAPEYPGLVQMGDDNDAENDIYPFGISSLADKRDFLQPGDMVKFQVAVVKSSGQLRATRICAVRKFQKAKVDSVKGQYGFLAYEHEEGKKLFFHMSEVNDNANIADGDEVEFVVIQNQKNKKYSACNVRKIGSSEPRPRPEHLRRKLKNLTLDEAGPKLIVIRQPRGCEDGRKGFAPRVARLPGVLIPNT